MHAQKFYIKQQQEFSMRSPNHEDTKFYSDNDLKRIAEELENAVTVPVNVEIQFEHHVYDFTEMKEILERARRIVVQDCGCKTEYRNCNAPRDVFLSLDETADELLANHKYYPREIDVKEAIEVLQRSHEAGLVHMAYTMKGEKSPGLVCSCCPCCCHTIGSLARGGVHTQILTSKYIASHDTEKCVECAACIERCVFQARRMERGKLVYDSSKCFGCGLCVSTCPMNASSLILRES
jgi:NAD-dependent dihydropyrimidine dehydrogenase PreA subunit